MSARVVAHPHPHNADAIHGRMLTVLPVIATGTTDLCVASLLRPDSAAEIRTDDLLLIDNSWEGWAAERYGLPTYRDPENHQLGVARSWNIGIDRLLDSDREYLTLMSASMLFGPILHTSWSRQLLAFWGSDVVESDGHSWHLIAIHRSVFERAGRFDTNFHAYFESIDWCYRLRLLGLEGGWPRVWVNALSQGQALHAPLISCPAEPLLAYYKAKWGGPKQEETFTLPFGDKPLDWFEDVPIPVLAERYGWTTWW